VVIIIVSDDLSLSVNQSKCIYSFSTFLSLIGTGTLYRFRYNI